jgi:hypothetical protein
MTDCPHCRAHAEVLQTIHASETELRDQVIALNRALAAAEKREAVLKGKLEHQHKTADEAGVIRSCLDVWEHSCWVGKGKPSVGLDGRRAERVRKALGWERIEAPDVCDAFHGLGLLPYRDKYNNRSKTLEPGMTRQSDVQEALGDEAKLERFRDYYRRVQASPMERRREQWWGILTVADQLYEALCTEGLWERHTLTVTDRIAADKPDWLLDAAERAIRTTLMVDGKADLLSDATIRLMGKLVIGATDDARFRDECERRQDGWSYERWQASQQPPKPALFVIEGHRDAA